jgi:hypothetical protein
VTASKKKGVALITIRPYRPNHSQTIKTCKEYDGRLLVKALFSEEPIVIALSMEVKE